MTPLRLTIGELAFAVAQATSYEKAVKLVSMQFDVERLEDALLLIQASAQSLHARELATRLVPSVELTPPMVAIGRVLGTSEWLLRCSKTRARETESLLLHLSPAGVLAHEVISEHVQRLEAVASLAELLGRAADFFGLAHGERALPVLRVPREAFEAIWTEPEPGKIAARLEHLRATGAPALLRSGLAEDLAAPSWRGGISRTYYPQGRAPDAHAALYIAAGRRTWLAEPDGTGDVTLGEATRQRFAEVAAHALDDIPSGERIFARA